MTNVNIQFSPSVKNENSSDDEENEDEQEGDDENMSENETTESEETKESESIVDVKLEESSTNSKLGWIFFRFLYWCKNKKRRVFKCFFYRKMRF